MVISNPTMSTLTAFLRDIALSSYVDTKAFGELNRKAKVLGMWMHVAVLVLDSTNQALQGQPGVAPYTEADAALNFGPIDKHQHRVIRMTKQAYDETIDFAQTAANRLIDAKLVEVAAKAAV